MKSPTVYFVEFSIPGTIENYGRNCGTEKEARDLANSAKIMAESLGKPCHVSVKKNGKLVTLE